MVTQIKDIFRASKVPASRPCSTGHERPLLQESSPKTGEFNEKAAQNAAMFICFNRYKNTMQTISQNLNIYAYKYLQYTVKCIIIGIKMLFYKAFKMIKCF